MEEPENSLSMRTDIARILIEQMNSQIRLLFSLSTAICAGIVVLFFQVLLNNSDPQKTKISLQWDWVLILTFILEGISIFLGYLSRGAIISLTPQIYKLASPDIEDWAKVDFKGNNLLRLLALYQFLLFLLGLVTILLVVLKNINQI